jgi:hypothetical protein
MVKNWKRRWFVLKDDVLYYFENTTDPQPKVREREKGTHD